jgi:hypothetical protein
MSAACAFSAERQKNSVGVKLVGQSEDVQMSAIREEENVYHAISLRS